MPSFTSTGLLTAGAATVDSGAEGVDSEAATVDSGAETVDSEAEGMDSEAATVDSAGVLGVDSVAVTWRGELSQCSFSASSVSWG